MAKLSAIEVEATWLQNGGTDSAREIAAAVALAESGGDTARINNTAYPNRPGYHPPAAGNLPEYSVGLWQINMLAHPNYTEAQLLTADGNAKATIAISANGELWGAWSTFTSGAYLPFLKQIQSAGSGSIGVAPVADSGTAPTMLAGWAAFKYAVNTTFTGHLMRGQHTLHDARVELQRATGGR